MACALEDGAGEAYLPFVAVATVADVVPLLNRFLGDLKQKPRNVFVRRYRFHESPKEIGEMYGIGEGYVRTMLARTRRKLKVFLKESVSDEQ